MWQGVGAAFSTEPLDYAWFEGLAADEWEADALEDEVNAERRMAEMMSKARG